jgi:cation diffusion facilitator CzcD-associated flavoprotein CzcO
MRVAIVGAGFSGIGMGAALQRAGHEYAIFERAGDLGGVWQHNTYPGACCDVPSYVYSYSWAQRRDWSRPCSPQAEIQEYLRQVATEQRVIGKIRFGTEVTEARWDPTRLKWTLALRRSDADGASGADGASEADRASGADGASEADRASGADGASEADRASGADGADGYEADALVLGCGQLSRPSWPQIPGATEFAGHSFHSAQWDHAHDLTGERVAVVGTGASAVQLIPEVAQRAAHLDVYQRSAPYLLPRRNRAYSDPVRQLLRRIPGAQRLRRYGMCGVMESITFGLTRSSVTRALLRAWSTSFMRIQLRGDPGLRHRARPDYPFGCKRILFSSSYLPALRRDDVELISDQIDRITAHGVVTRDGTERAVDTIIWGTGFQTNEFVLPMRVFGAGGAELQHSWRDGAEAHRGISVAGYPNMFLLYGPNTNLGAGSIIVMLEAQIRYVTRALAMIGNGRAIDVRPDTQRRYADDVQRRLRDTVWTGCHSWYRRGGDGRLVNNWPGFVAEYLRDTRDVDARDYAVLRPAPASAS